jgi:hypothetical protein
LKELAMTREPPRERIEPNPGDIRYVRRDARGRFTTDQVDASRSQGRDTQQHAKMEVKSGQGDRGDRRR